MYTAIAYRAAVALRAAPGVYSAREHASRVAPALFGPIVYLALRRVADGLEEAMSGRTRHKLSKLEKRKLSLIEDLKDSSRFERTFAILKKYDPAWVQREMRKVDAAQGAGTTPARAPRRGPGGGPAAASYATPTRAYPGAPPALPAPSGALAGAAGAVPGSRLLPLLSSALSRAATSLIADDPTALQMLREAQEEAAGLREEVERRGAMLEAARVEIDRLRAELGWPSLEEEEEERQKETMLEMRRGALLLHAGEHDDQETSGDDAKDAHGKAAKRRATKTEEEEEEAKGGDKEGEKRGERGARPAAREEEVGEEVGEEQEGGPRSGEAAAWAAGSRPVTPRRAEPSKAGEESLSRSENADALESRDRTDTHNAASTSVEPAQAATTPAAAAPTETKAPKAPSTSSPALASEAPPRAGTDEGWESVDRDAADGADGQSARTANDGD